MKNCLNFHRFVVAIVDIMLSHIQHIVSENLCFLHKLLIKGLFRNLEESIRTALSSIAFLVS